jgi:peptidoglycan hydrolase CwlO-like protein
MNKIEADLDILEQKIDFLLNTFHQYREENEVLKEKVINMDKEIEQLRNTLSAKDNDYKEVVYKLEKILS